MSDGLLNTLQDTLLAAIDAQKTTLGLKTCAKDLADIPVEGTDSQALPLVKYFPAVVVMYFGRSARRGGLNLEQELTYALIVATRGLINPGESDPAARALLDKLIALVDGKCFASGQQDYWTFSGDALVYKDAQITIYRMLFTTRAITRPRGA